MKRLTDTHGNDIIVDIHDTALNFNLMAFTPLGINHLSGNQRGYQ